MQQFLHQKALQSCTIFVTKTKRKKPLTRNNLASSEILILNSYNVFFTLCYTKPTSLERRNGGSVGGCTILFVHFIQCIVFSTVAAPYSERRKAVEVFSASKEA